MSKSVFSKLTSFEREKEKGDQIHKSSPQNGRRYKVFTHLKNQMKKALI